ncbi:MAG: response regulator, partial [Planctomycetes bacterium]|nr:response regulator [Planctomycetota bacterium]
IDDEAILRQRLQDLLKLDDHEVRLAGGGEEGLALCQEFKPEVILLDLRMPKMDGIEVLKRLRQDSSAAEVIVITGHGGVETAVEAMKFGAFSYLLKPVDYDELEIEIHKILGKQEMKRQIETYIDELEEAKSIAEAAAAEAVTAHARTEKQRESFEHDVRTTANSILGAVSLLEIEGAGAIEKCATHIHSACEELLSSISPKEVEERAKELDRLLAAGAPRKEGGASVLVVDDNQLNLKVMRMMLEKLGARCNLANNGAEAVALAGQKDYDLIFMDLSMPGMSGQEAVKEIRAQEKKGRRVRIYAVTADMQLYNEESGMDGFLQKPVRFSNLHKLLNR